MMMNTYFFCARHGRSRLRRQYWDVIYDIWDVALMLNAFHNYHTYCRQKRWIHHSNVCWVTLNLFYHRNVCGNTVKICNLQADGFPSTYGVYAKNNCVWRCFLFSTANVARNLVNLKAYNTSSKTISIGQKNEKRQGKNSPSQAPTM